MNTGIIIALVVVGIIWIASKLKKNVALINPFTTQVDFLRLYMLDKTENEFFDKDTDAAMEHGRDMLWDAAEEFRTGMHRAVTNKEKLMPGDLRLLHSAIRIVKAAEAMYYITEEGPILTEEPDEAEPTSEPPESGGPE